MADQIDLQKRLNGFSSYYLQRDGNLKNRSIHQWHLAFDIVASGVAAASGVFERIKIDGPTTSGYVLTTDAEGWGTWQESPWTSLAYRIHDDDSDTYVTTELTPDDDKVRIGTAWVERTVVDSNGLEQKSGDIAVQSDAKVWMDGMDGHTFWKYNSSTGYLEGWVTGSLRIEL